LAERRKYINARFLILTSKIILAAKKVGDLIKDTVSKIVKFGSEVVTMGVAWALGKVVEFVIPEVGKPIDSEEALNGVSKAANFIEKQIHTKLPPKLEKGAKIIGTVVGKGKAKKAMAAVAAIFRR
jgi:hypothetical protein